MAAWKLNMCRTTAAVAAIFAIGTAHADVIGNSADVFAVDIYSHGAPAQDAPPITFSPTLPVANSASAGLANAYAATYFGINKVSGSSGPYATVGSPNGNFASAISRWTDQVVITGGTGTGTVEFGVHLNGSLSTFAYLSSALLFNYDVNGQPTSSSAEFHYLFSHFPDAFGSPVPGYGSTYPCVSGPCIVDNEYTTTYTFNYGTPFLLSGLLYLNAGHSAPAFTATFADFSSTAVLNEVMLPNGATLQSASGTEYPLSAVPEPETYALLIAGLGLLGFVARRKRKLAR